MPGAVRGPTVRGPRVWHMGRKTMRWPQMLIRTRAIASPAYPALCYVGDPAGTGHSGRLASPLSAPSRACGMIGAMFSISDSLRSLILVSWRRADYHAHELAGSLRLGFTFCRPFLKRAECAVLRARLVRLEMLTRRLLVLMVLERPLPVIAVRRSGKGGAPGRKPARPARRLLFTRPVFRLSDPCPRPGTTRRQPPKRPAALRPRMLYLDQPLPPPEPGEYPPRPDDLIPAQALVRRAAALRDVYANPARHIARMTRRLAQDLRTPEPAPLLADDLPSIVRSPRQDAHERAAILELHHVALRTLAHPDMS